MPFLDAAFWEVSSYVVATLGLPFAIFLFLHEQRKERDAEDEEAYQLLQDAYNDFLKIVLDNPDLRLRSAKARNDLNEDQRERTLIIFEMLIALFERAYIVAYEPDLSGVAQRRWHSWDDYMRDTRECHYMDTQPRSDWRMDIRKGNYRSPWQDWNSFCTRLCVKS